MDLTLRAEGQGAAEEDDCLLRVSLAQIPRGGVLALEGFDVGVRERLRNRCEQLGYRVIGDPRSSDGGVLTVGKGGSRNGGMAPAVGGGAPPANVGSTGYSWSVRAHSSDGRVTRMHAGKHTLSAGPAVSFRPDEPLPSAVEHLLAALAADLVSSFASSLGEHRVEFDALECRLSGQLEDPLASIGVVGASGSPALSAIAGTVYLSAEAEQPLLRRAWCAAIARSPLFNTLAPCLALRIQMRAQL